MKKLNLRSLVDSNIKYDILKFPDGQNTISILNIKEDDLEKEESVLITTSITSWQDLEILVGANQILKEINPQVQVHLYITYLLGARSDRKFDEGSTNYLKNVIAPVINSQNFTSVIVSDPHSDVVEAVLDRSKPDRWPALFLTSAAVNRYRNSVLVSPDAGALKRVESIQKSLKSGFTHYVDEIIVAHKIRDIATGNIVKTHIDIKPEHVYKTLIIVDDICDGGRTFIELAKAAKSAGHRGKMVLVVTHGIFSKGLDELSQYFDNIYTSNSYHKKFDNVGSTSKLISFDIYK